MGKISTKELFDKYFESQAGTAIVLMRTQVDKPALYEYETEIGKELIDMDVDDLFGLILALQNKRKGKQIKFMTAHHSFDQVSTILRGVFNFYIDNYELIRNPWNDKRMKGAEATKRLAQGMEPFKFKMVQEIIDRLHADYEPDRADYVELIMLCFYSGFANAEEIVNTTTKMVNHRDRTISAPGRVIHLTNRCYELFEKFSNMEKMDGWRGDYLLVRWHDSYFKFITRPSKADFINERTCYEMRDIINRYMAKSVNDKYDTKINYHSLYMLGFYDFMVNKCGEEAVNSMITSYRNADDVTKLMSLAREYGVDIGNVTHLKRNLRPFIKYED